MVYRAPPSGITLDETDAAIAKGMLTRGDRQHDIAAWFGVNGGRIGEVAAGRRFRNVKAAEPDDLPPPGPYLSGRETAVMLQTLGRAKLALERAEQMLR
jgi:hypothetical protein